MYLSHDLIVWAIQNLRQTVQPFFGITFLAIKNNISTDELSVEHLNRLTQRHLMEYHRLDPDTDKFFQPFFGQKYWVSLKYSPPGIHSTNGRGTFDSIVRHKSGEPSWTLEPDYIEKLVQIIDLGRSRQVPILPIAIWIGKNAKWSPEDTLQDVAEKFLRKFKITDEERTALFCDTSDSLPAFPHFGERPAGLQNIAHYFSSPPFAPKNAGSHLISLDLKNVGPARSFKLDFGKRLTLIAGDNGLGKSFLLNVSWWTITGNWAGNPAYPLNENTKTDPRIQYRFKPTNGKNLTCRSVFDWTTHSWPDSDQRTSNLSIYVRIDGSFSIFDPFRDSIQIDATQSLNYLTTKEIWDGKTGIIEGLVRDLLNWQLSTNLELFPLLEKALEHLSPEDLGTLRFGNPKRVLGEPRWMPTIIHPYGEVPIGFASAGVQRILLLAYLIIWSWDNHVFASQKTGRQPTSRMLIVIDETEAHLHPRWQRTILPALLTIGKLLDKKLQIQIIASTHSPMVLASLEGDFSDDKDRLYHLEEINGDVKLKEIEYQKYGQISSWLTSPVFGLKHARSRGAEEAIEEARAIQERQREEGQDIRLDILNVTEKLLKYLGSDDPFWARWKYFAEKRNVKI